MTLPFNPNQELASIIARFATEDGEYRTPIDGLNLYRQSAATVWQHGAYRPCYAIVVQGRKTLTVGTDTYHYGVGEYILTALDLPVSSQVTNVRSDTPYLCFSMALDGERLKELLSRVNVPRQAVTAEPLRGLAVNAASPELLDASLRLLRLLDQPEDISAMAPLIEQEILYRLLTGPNGPRLLQVAMAESQSNRVARAVAWLRGNFEQPLRIEELAERVGMSVSSLHHHFKAVTAMSPMQYQKQLRLHEARRLMIVEQLDVGSAGHRVGYQSPSQFSREYSRLYGLPPLKDVEAMRNNAVAAE
ncbi:MULTISPECIES: AraC family transcriptional regulator [Rhizobium]|jgi:AraC-like DNA-binding protein|uniref:AraC-type DNA-binding protein n=1 Tax=Rhizobium lusitanum TaxID=293958 RepID=A0A1C3VSV1_9HYPH|nr:AraC family transcriptional regulator [Rhizobium lusitanum]NTJ07464.1 AraC family transcriptional regulator [Rhizobium lusitanum]SCB30876.1 AraC-type DNA-binding protein [Rhizobium lusitanum]